MTESNYEYDIKIIIKDIEEGVMTIDEILSKHNITTYKYYQILKMAEIKKPYAKTVKRRLPKNTKFKQMLKGSGDNENLSFDKESFIKDSKEGMKINELMDKYSLSLYQIRELRKKFDLKTK
jgi:hypothetical protein